MDESVEERPDLMRTPSGKSEWFGSASISIIEPCRAPHAQKRVAIERNKIRLRFHLRRDSCSQYAAQRVGHPNQIETHMTIKKTPRGKTQEPRDEKGRFLQGNSGLAVVRKARAISSPRNTSMITIRSGRKRALTRCALVRRRSLASSLWSLRI
jgi:hypothetical protein